MNKYIAAGISSIFLLSGAVFATAHANSAPKTKRRAKLFKNAQAHGLNADVLQDALNSYDWAKAHGDVKNPNVLTVINYNLPSTEKRLWVLNLKTDTVMTRALVAHGHNSGYVYAKHFSNSPNSHETSLGVYETATSTFYGKHGRSLKVHGLEQGINNNAYSRAIEIHPASYVSQYDIKHYGRIGRTYGCFGLSPKVAEHIISETKGGSVLFAYASPENSDPVATEA